MTLANKIVYGTINNSNVEQATCPTPIFDLAWRSNNVTLEFSGDNGRHWILAEQRLHYIQLPKISSISPTFFPAYRNAYISVMGNYFVSNYINCRWNSTITTKPFFSSSQSVICITPGWLFSGVYTLDVTNDGIWFSNQMIFTVYNDPIISSVFLPLGSTVIIVTGLGFINNEFLQ